LEYTENNRFVQDITADITRMNEDQQTLTLVGRLAAYKVLLREAEHNGWDAFSIFDVDQATMNVGDHIYDVAKDDWDKKVRSHYKDDLFGSDVLILARIEILPEYRGQGIALKQ
jgi:GNAT superfamily N-acetyltransferase